MDGDSIPIALIHQELAFSDLTMGTMWSEDSMRGSLLARRPSLQGAGGLLESCEGPEGGSVWGIRARRGLLLGDSTGFFPRIRRIFPSGKIPENEGNIRYL